VDQIWEPRSEPGGGLAGEPAGEEAL